MLPRSELLRLVRSADGAAQVDPGGVLPGRGAYVCRRPECAKRVQQRGVLQRALRAPVTVPRETLDLVTEWQRSASIR